MVKKRKEKTIRKKEFSPIVQKAQQLARELFKENKKIKAVSFVVVVKEFPGFYRNFGFTEFRKDIL